MLYNTEAVVVRNIAYGETHAIVTLLTPKGLVAALARGAKKPQSRLAAAVQLCVQGVYTLYQNKGMGTVQQVEIVDSRRPLREHLRLAAYAAYFCESVLAVAEDRPNGNEQVYRWFTGALGRLQGQREDARIVARIWETKLLRMTGASPDWLHCIRCAQAVADSGLYSIREGGFLCSGCRQASTWDEGPGFACILTPPNLPRVLLSFERVEWERLGTVNVSQETLQAADRVLSNQLREFAGIWPKSRDFLTTVDEVLGDDA